MHSILRTRPELPERPSEVLQLLYAGGDPAEAVEESHDLVPAEAEAAQSGVDAAVRVQQEDRIGIRGGGGGGCANVGEEDLEGRAQAGYLQDETDNFFKNTILFRTNEHQHRIETTTIFSPAASPTACTCRTRRSP